jgi:hypothetical protein
MKCLTLLLAVGALGTGLWAACKWLIASGVKLDLGYTYPGMQRGETYRRMGMDFPRTPEPADFQMQQGNLTVAT